MAKPTSKSVSKPTEPAGNSPEKRATGTAVTAATITTAELINRGFMYWTIAVAGCAADLISKEAIFAWRGLPQPEHEYWLIQGYVGIETSLNRGALFGMGAGFSSLFAVLSVSAITGIMVWLFAYRAAADRLLTVILAMITGGILGNLYDRLGIWSRDLPAEFGEYRYAVRDWILFRYKQHTWPNFNIADCLLVIGAGLMMYQSFRTNDKEEPLAASPKQDVAAK